MDGYAVRPAVSVNNAGYASYPKGVLPINMETIEEYMSMWLSIDTLILKKLSMPTQNGAGQWIGYELVIPSNTMCAIMLACLKYVVSSATIKNVDNTIFAQMWQVIYIASTNRSDAARWIKEKMDGRSRRDFCIIHNVRLTGPRDRGETTARRVDAHIAQAMSSGSFSEVRGSDGTCESFLRAGECNDTFAAVECLVEQLAVREFLRRQRTCA
jgi:hypothetical protein